MKISQIEEIRFRLKEIEKVIDSGKWANFMNFAYYADVKYLLKIIDKLKKEEE